MRTAGAAALGGGWEGWPAWKKPACARIRGAVGHLGIMLALTLLAAGAPARVSADEGSVSLSCRVSIVGAGYGGAYFAWRLCVDSDTFACDDVCVFEANQRAGGRSPGR
jgi:hypothetical protein